jgi:Secretion system C-terminal sorting domain
MLNLFTSNLFGQCLCDESHSITAVNGQTVVSLSNWINTHQPAWSAQQNAMVGGCLTVAKNVTLSIDKNYEFSNNQVKAYPNPSNNELNIVWDFPLESSAQISIVDIAGRIQYLESASIGSTNITLQTNKIPSGMYFYLMS